MTVVSLLLLGSNVNILDNTESTQASSIKSLQNSITNLNTQFTNAGLGAKINTLNSSIDALNKTVNAPIATFYANTNYGGSKLEVTPKIFDTKSGKFDETYLKTNVGSSAISSLKTNNGYTAQLFEGTNFGSSTVNIYAYGSIPDLSTYSFDNKAKSVQLWKNTAM